MGVGRRVIPRAAALVLAALLAFAGPAGAQQVDPAFDAALSSFRSGDWDAAAARFDAVAADHPDGPNATAALVMAGKARYRAGRYGEAAATLDAFLERHPDSRYAADARATLGLARDALAALAARPVELGIILSLSGDEALQSQALFNGIRMAVEAWNQTADRPVRMVFREIGADPGTAGAAVRTLAAEGVRVVIGGLFSDQAREAAAAAESAGAVYVAPLATDDHVSYGRSLAFQANPSIETRGRLMARMAVNGLLLRTLATVAAPDARDLSFRMTAAFIDEARSLGAEVPIEVQLASPADWYRLDTILSADTLRDIRGLYMPLAGAQTDRTAGAVLSALDRMRTEVRVLGNAEWHDLPILTQASRYATTYTNDYLPDTTRADTRAFRAAYLAFAGIAPDRLVHAGYDVTRFLLQATAGIGLDGGARVLADALRSAPAWEGVAHRIHFDGGQINRAMFYHRYRDGRLELLR